MFVYVINAKLRASELFKTPQRRLVDFTKSTRISPHGNRHHATLPSAWIVEDLHQFQHPPTFQVVWVMASTMFQHVFFFWGSYMIYSGSWSPQLQLPRLSLWMSQRASPCRGWLSKTITTWLWPTEALKLVVQHETHHVSSCFNPSPKYQQYPTVSNSQYVRWVHGDDHPISRRWTHTHTFETTTSQMWSLVEHLGKSVSYGGKLQKVRNLQRNIGPIHHQEPRYSNRCKKMK